MLRIITNGFLIGENMSIPTNENIPLDYDEAVELQNTVFSDKDYLNMIKTHIQMIDSYLDKLQINSNNMILIIEAKGELVRLNKKLDKLI